MTRTALLLLASIAFAPPALAQGISRATPQREHLLETRYYNAAAGATTMGGFVLPSDRGFQASRITTWVNAAGGGGAGNTTFVVTDGTLTCTCTLTCAASASTGGKSVSCSGQCSFAPSAALQTNITASTCTTTQPTLLNVDTRGYWN